MSPYAKDPKRKWERKNYDESKLHRPHIRADFELETDRDLDKPPEQLVCDVHEETNNIERPPLENIAHAQKRMVSMMARIAKSNQKLTRWIIVLTVIITVLTLMLVLKTFMAPT